MKRYIGDDYTFIINRVKVSDRGEFIIRAENHYGVTEEIVFLNVQVCPITPLFSDGACKEKSLMCLKGKINDSSLKDFLRSHCVLQVGPKKYQKIASMYDRTGLSTKCTLIKSDLF